MKKEKILLIVGIILSLAILTFSFIKLGLMTIWYLLLVAGIIGIILTGLKKHGHLKILAIILLLVVLASCTIIGRQGIISYLGLGDVLLNTNESLYYFFYIVLFVLAVGGFYGVLNKTQSYKKLLDNITTKVKPLGKKFIFITIIILALLSSFTGMTLPLIIFVPFVVSIVVLLGYDKLVALSTSILSIIIGSFGGVFLTFMNPNTYSMNTFETFVGLGNQFDNMFPKLLLLFAGITLLIYYVNKHIINVENKKVKYELSENSELTINEVTGDYKKVRTWPIIVVLSLILVIITLGMIPWVSLFNVNIFTDFHTWLTGLTIKDFAVFPNTISSSFPALGEWTSSGDSMAYILMSILLLFFSTIVAIVGKVKVDDAIDGYVEGMKKMLPSAGLIIVAYGILVCSYTNGFLDTIINNYGKFNYGLSSLLGILGCILNVDTYYIIGGTFSTILNLITDESIYASVAILFQGISGIFSLVGPTSLILIFGLTYMDVPYTTYIKYIWRFVLSLVILLALVTLLIVVL